MLYRITTLEKSERFGTLPLTFSLAYSNIQTIPQNSFKPLIVKGFYLLRMSDDYGFRMAVQGRLSKCNSRNTANVLKAAVKSHKALKGTKVFAYGCSGRNLKNFSKFTVKSSCWSKVVALK